MEKNKYMEKTTLSGDFKAEFYFTENEYDAEFNRAPSDFVKARTKKLNDFLVVTYSYKNLNSTNVKLFLKSHGQLFYYAGIVAISIKRTQREAPPIEEKIYIEKCLNRIDIYHHKVNGKNLSEREKIPFLKILNEANNGK